MSTALRLTVAEYDAMVAKGAFDELAQKIELIYGEIQAMNPAGPLHDDLVGYLTTWSIQSTAPEKVGVRIQSGLALPDQESRPEPDILWVKAKRYSDSHPGSGDVLLAIEVSNSSLVVDRDTKFELYAKAGIAEYWIVDVAHKVIHVCREPESGRYKTVAPVECGDSISPLAAPDAVLELSALFV